MNTSNTVRLSGTHDFGPLYKFKPDIGLLIILPPNCMRKACTKGRIKKNIVAKLRDLTLENMLDLNEKHGVTFEAVNKTLVLEKLRMGGTLS